MKGEDWFEAVTTTNKESDEPDWFDEVNEDGDESDDEGSSSTGALANVFGGGAPGDAIVSAEMVSAEMVDSGMHACGSTTIFEDSGITSHVWPVRNDHANEFSEGADRSSGAHTASHEGEYGGGRTTSESSGRMPDLDLFENPWIESPTMKWRNHAIAEQINETKIRPSDDHKRGRMILLPRNVVPK